MIKVRGIYWPAAAWHRYRKPKPGARRKTMGGSSTLSIASVKV